MKKIQAIRGMHDVLPTETPLWQFFETQVKNILSQYGYQEIRMPVLEVTELFKRSIGEVTDIVEKEMYTFADRNGDSLTLRPEGTASCVRACIQHGLLHNQQQRLWYQGPMFRHERPQKGRYRQFYQIGVECYGLEGPDIDIELILITQRLWKALGLNDLQLQINTLGSSEERAVYRDQLVAYLSQYHDQLDEDSQRRLLTNPLRVLDTKNPAMADIVANAPQLLDVIGEPSRQHFATICAALDEAGVNFVVNPRLVRGLDYYSRTVFEWVTDRLGAQGTVCAGGRYDGLVEQLAGKATPAVGFAMGIERLIALLEEQGEISLPQLDVYVVLLGDVQAQGIALSEQLRNDIPSIRIQMNCGGGSVKSQFKKADKSGAQFALIIGEDEIEQQSAAVKFLRDEGQEKVAFSELSQWFAEKIGSHNE